MFLASKTNLLGYKLDLKIDNNQKQNQATSPSNASDRHC